MEEITIKIPINEKISDIKGIVESNRKQNTTNIEHRKEEIELQAETITQIALLPQLREWPFCGIEWPSFVTQLVGSS